ncbi:gag-polypeptide of LTR copia-type [Rhizoctonia solani]|uniref:Gag-polypeptide of LTR copia-type n=1 Tax=Rhizoctonia solani TaxID=456999 RepID=A0A8H7LKV5_9AGAM|nr:gag-polypeptide of LTR copia-type [Rhizoctonia solani]KAF8680382.1 gag-polypeptide of LTR copia-type [Rhizoctonia solani]
MSPAGDNSKEDSSKETKPNKTAALYTMQSTKNSYLSKKTYKIPLLKDNGSNYTAWKFRQTTVLRMRKLDTIAWGKEKPPAKLTGTNATDKTKVNKQEAAYSKWKLRNNEAFAQITLNMEDGCMANIVETTTAYEAWTRIVKCWEGKGMQLLLFLYQQLMQAKIDKGKDLQTGFNAIKATVAKITMLGKTVSNFMLAQIIMNALPPSYAIVNTVLQTSLNGGAITAKAVQNAAYAKEERCCKGGRITAMFAQLSKGNSTGKKLLGNNSKGKKKAAGPPCANCRKSRHTKQECWSKGGGAKGTGLQQKRQNLKQSNQKTNKPASTSKNDTAKVAVTNKPSTSATGTRLYALLALDTCLHNNNVWLLNSGASRHMTPNCNWFFTYQCLNPPTLIQVGNGNLLYTTVRWVLASGGRRLWPYYYTQAYVI